MTSVAFSGLDDSEHLKRVAAVHDIVIHTACGFHTGSAQALMEGLAERKKKTGNDAHYIHVYSLLNLLWRRKLDNAWQTSGTWNLADAALSANQVVAFSDEEDDIVAMEASLDAQDPFPQRTTDLAVIAASEETGVKSYILMPPDVYGLGTGRSNQQSSLIKDMISEAITQSGPRHVEDGSGEVGHVHVVDLAALYEVLLRATLDGKTPDSGRKGIYFCSSGSHVWGDVAKAIGEAAVEFGVLQSAESTPMDVEVAARKWTGGIHKDLKRGYCARLVFRTPSTSSGYRIGQISYAARQGKYLRVETDQDGRGLAEMDSRLCPYDSARWE